MPQTIARFMQLAQEQALHEKITSLQERYDQEIKALRAVITNLQNRHNEYYQEISSLQKEVTTLRTFPVEQDRPLGQPYPQGVKRARADDEAPRREEDCGGGKMQSREDRAAARQEEFVDYFKSMRDEFTAGNYGKYERAFICRFIDGIQDPVLSRWFQESLKERFPDKIHEEKRSSRKGGGRLVRPTRDLAWNDIEMTLKHSEWPSMDD